MFSYSNFKSEGECGVNFLKKYNLLRKLVNVDFTVFLHIRIEIIENYDNYKIKSHTIIDVYFVSMCNNIGNDKCGELD